MKPEVHAAGALASRRVLVVVMTKQVQPNSYIFTIVADQSVLWADDDDKHIQSPCRRSCCSAISLTQVVICFRI